MKIPKSVPELGFYYHFRHDPTVSIENCAYELVGIGINTEEDCGAKNENLVIYRPLYKDSPVYKSGKLSWARPIDMWSETVIKNGSTYTRFSKISDLAIIEKLKKIRDEIYPS